MSQHSSFLILSGERGREKSESRRASRNRALALRLAFGLLLLVSAGGLAVAFLPSRTPPGERKNPVAIPAQKPTTPEADEKNAEYLKTLTAEQYKITREKGTEKPFTGKYWNHKEDGIYKCVCCGTPLFDSANKYDSGTGWPSFTEPMEEKDIKTAMDLSLLTTRFEVLCRKCDAHLGHVFDDGIKPTGLRYSINSAALNFEKRAAKPKAGH